MTQEEKCSHHRVKNGINVNLAVRVIIQGTISELPS